MARCRSLSLESFVGDYTSDDIYLITDELFQNAEPDIEADKEREEDEEATANDNNRNPDNFEKLSPIDSFDEDEGEFPATPGGAHVEGGEPGTELDSQEGELGIRRSSSAKSNKIEDMTLSESNKIEDMTLSEVILDPDGNVTYYWLGMVTTAVVYNIAVIVLRLAFKEMRDPVIQESVFYACDSLGDLIFVLDIFVHLRVSFYEDGCLVLDPSRVVERYTRNRKFVLDLLAILPLGTIYAILSGLGSMVYIDPSLYIAADVHIMMVRIPRLLKYPTMIRFFDLTDSRTRNPNLVRTFKLSLNLWLVIHWVGCLYYMVSEYEGLGTNGWVYPSGTEYASFTRKYIRVMYWSLMTLTTIGERPAPETDLEFVFTGFTFLIGVFVFAAVVGNVGDVITNMNASRQEFQSRMDQIKSYLQHRNVDEQLQNRVKRWANYTWTRTQAIDEPTLLQMLPDRLRTEIAINVHLETLKKVKIFEECEEGLLRELVLKLRPQVYSPGDYICRIGEVGREMYIVNHGKVEILVPSSVTGRRTVIATLNPGNYFGEISLLKIDDGQNRRTADVRAVGYSELLRLSRKDLMSALVEYPNAKRILEQQAMERIQKTNLMRRTSCETTPPAVTPDERPPPKKKDLLLQVIKSPNFQKLIAHRNSDVKELKHVIEELKHFDSQASKDRFDALTKERDDLKHSLEQTTEELDSLRKKLASVMSIRRTNITCSGHVKNGNKHVLTRSPALCTCYHSDTERATGGTTGRVCRTNNRSSGAVKTRSTYRDTTSVERKRALSDTVADGQSKCTCRSLRHSFSDPNFNSASTLKSKVKSTAHNDKLGKAEKDKDILLLPKENGVNGKIPSVPNDLSLPLSTLNGTGHTLSNEQINDIDNEEVQESVKSETTETDTEKDLEVLEKLLTLDSDHSLSDTSDHSSDDDDDDDESSDCELDFDVESIDAS